MLEIELLTTLAGILTAKRLGSYAWSIKSKDYTPGQCIRHATILLHSRSLQPSPGLQSTMALISALHGPQQCSGTTNEWLLIRQPREALPSVYLTYGRDLVNDGKMELSSVVVCLCSTIVTDLINRRTSTLMEVVRDRQTSQAARQKDTRRPT